jgi:hypothetical protein
VGRQAHSGVGGLPTAFGRGLTRNWAPWVAVANVEGILRLDDLDETTARLVLRP